MSNNNGKIGEPLLQVDDLKMYFPIYRGVFQRKVGDVRAVDGISFDVKRGETLGLVGESGCGKSTTGRAILQLYKPTAGEVVFDGVDLIHLKGEELRQMRRKMQMIFQDPYASLNPRMTVEQIVGDVAVRQAVSVFPIFSAAGSMLVKIAYSEMKNPAFPAALEPDALQRIEFMLKDSKRFADTGGWGYARFVYNAASNTYTPYGKDAAFANECYQCHTLVKDRNYVFTKYPVR